MGAADGIQLQQERWRKPVAQVAVVSLLLLPVLQPRTMCLVIAGGLNCVLFLSVSTKRRMLRSFTIQFSP